MNENTKLTMKIPEQVKYIMKVLNDQGYEAYAVGGCVRDRILGREPMDWDMTTSALPEETKKYFEKTIDTGIQHGTITVMLDGEPFEVTTYRIDGEYEDCRRPKEVFFTKNIVEDLQRRDFTINAMAYHPEEGVVDPFEGQADLKRKLIKCVGNPDHRFDEDALRMLRAVRFAAKLDFDIDGATANSIGKKNHLIANVSGERIRDELNKLLLSDHPEKFDQLYDFGLLHYIMPEFEPCYQTPQKTYYHVYNVAEHTIATIKAVKKDPVLRWTMLFHDLGKAYTRTRDEEGFDHFPNHEVISMEKAKTVMQRLKFDNKTMKSVLHLIEHHDYRPKAEACEVRKAMKVIGLDLFSAFIEVQLADAKGQNPDNYSKREKEILGVQALYEEALEKGHCTTIKDLALNGNDLQALGVPRGKAIGETLGWLLDQVIQHPEWNNKDRLSALIQESSR